MRKLLDTKKAEADSLKKNQPKKESIRKKVKNKFDDDSYH